MLTGLFDQVGLKKNVRKCGDDLTSTPGVRDIGRQSLYPADYGGREGLQGETVGEGLLLLFQEVIGKGVTGCALPNLSCSGKGGSGIGGQCRRRGRQSQDLQDGVSNKVRVEALPSRGV